MHISKKGEKIHQFTIGAGGKILREICQSQIDRTQGDFYYAENKYHGFALV